MKSFYFFFFAFTSTFAIAQIDYQEGYYIDNAGQKVQVQIKYVEWKNNPTEFTVRQSENSTPRTLLPKDVTGFGVTGEKVYITATVPVDQSNPNLKYLSNHGQFESKEETVFLEVLVDGEADLFQLQRGNLQQFFFRVNDETIQPLVYKRFVPPSSVKIAENKQYLQQLFNGLKCEGITQEEISETRYKKSDLVSLFSEYNQCQDSDFKDFTKVEENRDAFNLRIRPGINFASLKLNTHVVPREMNFGNKTNFRLGLEGEYILPFFRNKWGFIVEPTYQYYEGQTVFPEPNPLPDGTVYVKYQSVELPFGVRHYFFLNKDHQVFVNATYTIDFVVGESRYDFETAADYPDTRFETNSGTNISFGAGYNYKKFQVEARYNADREVGISGTAYSTFALIFGYNFL